MLLANYAQANRNVASNWGIAFTNPHAMFKATLFHAFYCGGHVVAGETDRSAFNNGYNVGHLGGDVWHLAPKAGGMSSANQARGVGDLTSAIAGGLNAEATLTGSGTMAATGQLIVSLVASLSGSGTISSAVAEAFLQLAASLSGSGSMTAVINAKANAEAALSGSGALSAPVLTALGTLLASIEVTGTGLTTSNVGSAVWSALAASNNDAGSMGEKLNDAGSAANPWTEVIESGLTAAQVLRLIAAAVQGDATGLESGSPVFKSIDGSVNRIVATYVNGVRVVSGRDPN